MRKTLALLLFASLAFQWRVPEREAPPSLSSQIQQQYEDAQNHLSEMAGNYTPFLIPREQFKFVAHQSELERVPGFRCAYSHTGWCAGYYEFRTEPPEIHYTVWRGRVVGVFHEAGHGIAHQLGWPDWWSIGHG